jgi:hypothetical protein
MPTQKFSLGSYAWRVVDGGKPEIKSCIDGRYSIPDHVPESVYDYLRQKKERRASSSRSVEPPKKLKSVKVLNNATPMVKKVKRLKTIAQISRSRSPSPSPKAKPKSKKSSKVGASSSKSVEIIRPPKTSKKMPKSMAKQFDLQTTLASQKLAKFLDTAVACNEEQVQDKIKVCFDKLLKPTLKNMRSKGTLQLDMDVMEHGLYQMEKFMVFKKLSPQLIQTISCAMQDGNVCAIREAQFSKDQLMLMSTHLLLQFINGVIEQDDEKAKDAYYNAANPRAKAYDYFLNILDEDSRRPTVARMQALLGDESASDYRIALEEAEQDPRWEDQAFGENLSNAPLLNKARAANIINALQVLLGSDDDITAEYERMKSAAKSKKRAASNAKKSRSHSTQSEKTKSTTKEKKKPKIQLYAEETETYGF